MTFKNWDGTEITVMENVEHGRTITAPVNPTRDSHRFIGWSKDFDNITGDIEIFALFSPENNNKGISEPVLWAGIGIALIVSSGIQCFWMMKKPRKKRI